MTTSASIAAPYTELPRVRVVDALPVPISGVSTSSSPLLVATNGSMASAAALRIAAAIARRDGRPIQAAFVEETMASVPSVTITGAALLQERVPESTRLGRVRQQLCTILGQRAWTLRVAFGRLGPTLARAAREAKASLLITGLTREGLARRLLGSGTVARVLQASGTPVLAVPATARMLPRTIVAAIDFSPASLRAARVARDLLERPGTLHLVNVRPAGGERTIGIVGWNAIYDAGAKTKLEELADELSGDGITIRSHIATGDVVDALLGVALEEQADAIACGDKNPSSSERQLLGATPSQLLLIGDHAVLIAPAAVGLG